MSGHVGSGVAARARVRWFLQAASEHMTVETPAYGAYSALKAL